MDLSKLNPPQREAVVTTEGPLLVLAGAGSGKTRVITHRIAYLLGKGVSARSILAVTFTNKAAAEMKERVVHLAGKAAAPVLVSTFHAFGAEVLREDLWRLGYPKKFAIADQGDQMALVRRAMKERRIDDRTFDARKVLVAISRAKNAGIVPEPLEEGRGDDYDLITSQVFPLYQLALRAQGAVDFDDLIVLPSRLFRELPDVKARFVRRFRYLLVDEFQDTNAAQLELLRLLAAERRNVCAVGDDDQAIYSWRGAEVRNILEFDRHFPGAREVRLEQNYRSTQLILDAANAVIAMNEERKPKRMWSDRRGGSPIRLLVCPDEEEEARIVAREVQKALEAGTSADDIAVLYRTNGQSRPLEEALRERDIAYEVVGGSEFFDKREVKDVIAYFKVISNPLDEVSLLRIINVPTRGIGDVTVERLTRHARTHHLPLFRSLADAKACEELSPGAAESVLQFHGLIERYRAAFQRGNLAEVTRRLLEETGFREAARAATPSATVADRKLKSVDQVLASLEAFEKREGTKADLMTYLNRLSLDTRAEEDEGERAGRRRVTLMTLHGAKGLEWRVVFLVGMEEELLPHKGMQGEAQNLPEERRLAYVGLTRAREQLVLTRAAVRVRRGQEVPRTPSRFLSDIPPELVEVVDATAPPPGPPSERELKFFASLKDRLKAGGAL
ncbi:MAG: UvrD-helicase domain-containing protein [Myxococcaceae bacterium]|nr:UvrD-helicase domain-containing protein [Myxococcaceae bacterium]MCI0672464.1 UvrD-helicase domain-containing protein [Myxococcaceae bacterium]